MIDLIKEQKELFKNQLLDYINESIKIEKKQLSSSIEPCDINYFNGSLNTLYQLKFYIREM